jgi:hypothetical protein
MLLYSPDTPYLPPPLHAWRLLLQGKITSFNHATGRATIKYDDGQSEALMLCNERLQWYTPRARSAGYRPALHAELVGLEAEGLALEPVAPPDTLPEVSQW